MNTEPTNPLLNPETLREATQSITKKVARILRNPDDVAEIVQATLEYALQPSARYRGEAEGGYIYWLRGIARNMALQRLKTLSREVSLSGDGDDDGDGDGYGDDDALWIGRPIDPADAARCRELERDTRECFDRLKPEQRLILELQIDDEVSVAEIAMKGGLALETLNSRLKRARYAIRECLRRKGW
jgi:RNA polymerase sigma factor (sigma-70 family)